MRRRWRAPSARFSSRLIAHGLAATDQRLHHRGMSRLIVATASAALVAAFVVASQSSGAAAGPPPGLTDAGKLFWDLDALVNTQFGHQPLCLQHDGATLTPASGAYCVAKPQYQVLFANARGGPFRLSSRLTSPFKGPYAPNAVAVRIGGRYVSCGNGTWLAVVNAWSTNWPVICVKP